MEIKKYKMKYKINKSRYFRYSIKILSKEFIKNNENKAKLIFENKEYELSEFFDIDDFKSSELKINILFNRDISNLSCMFKDCESLFEFSIKDDIENKNINYEYDNQEIEDNIDELEEFMNKGDKDKETIYNSLNDEMKSEFSEIKNIKNIPENTETFDLETYILQLNYLNNEEMIYKCDSFSSIPEFSIWNVNIVIDMNHMFYKCESLSSLPDISK